MERESLTQLCERLATGSHRRSDVTGPTESQLELRRRVLTLPDNKSEDVLAEEHHLRSLLADASLDEALRREAMVCLATLLQAHPHLVDQRGAYRTVVQALLEPSAALDHWMLSGALCLARGLAHACSKAPPAPCGPESTDMQANEFAEPSSNRQGAQQVGAVVGGQTPKRVCTGTSQLEAQPAHHSEAGAAQPAAAGRTAAPRTLSHAHVRALHAGLVAWATHWHPRCREAALEGLMALHGAAAWGRMGMHGAPVSPASTPAVSFGPTEVTGAYEAAVVCMADDVDRPRLHAASLVAALALQAPRAVLPHPRFGYQAGQPIALGDDAFQRLCAAAACDVEAGVRAHAFSCLEGLVRNGVGGARVRLQSLSKKATLKAALPSDSPSGGPQPQPQKQQPHRTKGGRGRGQGGAGAGGGGLTGGDGDGAAVEGSSVWHEAPWSGAAGARAALPLFDASAGALVHGSEDESSAVRLAVVGVLGEIAAQEVQVLLQYRSNRSSQQTGPGSNTTSIKGWGKLPPAAASALQACEQCCSLLVDLLHDAVRQVRAAAAQALERVCCPLSTNPMASHETQQGNRDTADAGKQGDPGGMAAARRKPATASGLPLLDRDQVEAVIAALCDGCGAARRAVMHLLAAAPLPSHDHLMQLASGLADVGGRYPSDLAHVLDAARSAAARMPDAARAVAAAIAAAAAASAPAAGPTESSGDAASLQQVPPGMVCLPRTLRAASSDVQQQGIAAGTVVSRRPALLVMAALVEGAGGEGR